MDGLKEKEFDPEQIPAEHHMKVNDIYLSSVFSMCLMHRLLIGSAAFCELIMDRVNFICFL